MEFLALFGKSVSRQAEISDAWHQAYGVAHLIARLTLKRTEQRAFTREDNRSQEEQVQLSLEIASLKAEITEWLVKRPMPGNSWVQTCALHPSLVVRLASFDIPERQLAAKAALIIRDYWFAKVVPHLAHDEPTLNAATFRNMCDALVEEAMTMRKQRKTKIIFLRGDDAD